MILILKDMFILKDSIKPVYLESMWDLKTAKICYFSD